MSELPAKTSANLLTDTLSQLKEMRHYAKTNVEHLTASWMLFDGELKSLQQTEKFEDLMNRQTQFHDVLEHTIGDLEAQLKQMAPEPEPAA